MAHVVFTRNLQRHLETPECEVRGATVAAVLAALFAKSPQLRSYLLDDQERLRKHVNVFIDGVAVADRVTLADPVREDAEIYVMQALSGG